MSDSLVVNVGGVKIGGGNPIVVQTMCNTHTYDEEATIAQCRRLAAAGSQLIRITVPGPSDVAHIRNIRDSLRAEGIMTPLVADIHFSAETALMVAPVVDKVRINPGNFHRDHAKARDLFGGLIDVCRENGTAIRIGVNHGSLGEYITNLYGNTPHAMAEAAMEWIRMCAEKDFYNVVVSLKSSNTVVMTQAYKELSGMMEKEGVVFPLHVGVTEAGNGDSGRMKSCVGCSALLSEGIGDTIRVSLTEDPEAELPVARYLSDRYGRRLYSSLVQVKVEDRIAYARYEAPSRERLICDLACDFGKTLLDGNLDDVKVSGTYVSEGQIVPLDDSPLAASSPRLSGRFPFLSYHSLMLLQPRRRHDDAGLGSVPFDRHYSGYRFFFLFLRVLRCFSSPRSLRTCVRWRASSPPGCPIRKRTDQFLFADPRALSQLTTSFVASRSQGILRSLFSSFSRVNLSTSRRAPARRRLDLRTRIAYEIAVTTLSQQS